MTTNKLLANEKRLSQNLTEQAVINLHTQALRETSSDAFPPLYNSLLHHQGHHFQGQQGQQK
jgi:hypothetical protein